MREYDLIIVGGGPAGLAAAISAKKEGIDNLLILERDHELGGILNQCIHNGFGLHTFKEELTGPEYAYRFIEEAEKLEIPYKLNTMVLDISQEGREKTITAMNREDGLMFLKTKAVVLAMGCRERPRGALNIPGYRPAGIYTAGTAQRLVNMEGYMPGKEVVILGSGDIGLIMARRMTLEGAKVKVVAELLPYSGGLQRNIVQCLNDFDIPLKLSHTVVDIQGKERVTGITLAEVDENRKPIPGTEEFYSCDTLLLSCGLIPENELSGKMGVELSRVTSGPVVNESLETNVEGVFACGNVLHVHDLVDYVSEEAARAGSHAAEYIRNWNSGESNEEEQTIRIQTEGGIRYSVPQIIRTGHMEDTLTVRFRVGAVYRDAYISVYCGEKRILHKKKKKLAPGEMEQVVLKKQDLTAEEGLDKIVMKVEEAS
ncbi:MAG TPA: FAD-dependent oxidoreductase [Candidatus Blautia merdavium]|uniref:FAD-dependent oxidoreductase n=1 Tax=Candidatus Blautia merdavium TaxID=2838494 RepID=A0A9D2PKU6_9FIRM|nr:FAD-dependent oxidoreductase [Candidatus Blautia merdavium]